MWDAGLVTAFSPPIPNCLVTYETVFFWKQTTQPVLGCTPP